MPSTVSPWLAWKLRTAASVSGPKMPSTLIEPSALLEQLHLAAFAARS